MEKLYKGPYGKEFTHQEFIDKLRDYVNKPESKRDKRIILHYTNQLKINGNNVAWVRESGNYFISSIGHLVGAEEKYLTDLDLLEKKNSGDTNIGSTRVVQRVLTFYIGAANCEIHERYCESSWDNLKTERESILKAVFLKLGKINVDPSRKLLNEYSDLQILREITERRDTEGKFMKNDNYMEVDFEHVLEDGKWINKYKKEES